jgi:DNA (cytosine-5)-methyltransferase 1
MRYASVCDGIGAAHVAWQPLGWECAWTSEIEPFPAAVVDHHWKLKNLGDMTKLTEEMLDEHGSIDLLVGGTPCQSFSVAGLRGGLADPRGNLALRFVQLAAVMQPKWIVWENVPGVLSSGKGRDFGTFLGALGELGYGFAYRVLDAQWFGVAQRRRRVFVVGHLGDWRRAAAVLFERESVFGNPPTRGAKGQGTARRSQSGADTCGTLCADKHPGAYSGQDAYTGRLVAEPFHIDPAAFNQGQNAQYEAQITQSGVAAAMVARGPAAIAFGGQMSTPQVDVAVDTYNQSVADVSIPLRVGNAKDSLPAAMVPFTKSKRAQSTTDDETWVPGEVSPTMSCFDQGDTRATTVVAIQERAICENPDAGPDGVGVRVDGVSYTLEARTVPQAVAFTQNSRDEVRQINGDGQIAGALSADAGMHQTNYVAYDVHGTQASKGASETDCHTALRSRPPGQSEASTTTVVCGSGHTVGTIRSNTRNNSDPVTEAAMHVMHGMAVRRLTPKECERLQGFPDGYTDVTYRGKPAADGPRYRALGNSMAVPVMAWIGKRIQMVMEATDGTHPQH